MLFSNISNQQHMLNYRHKSVLQAYSANSTSKQQSLEEASTHKSVITYAGGGFYALWLDLLAPK